MMKWVSAWSYVPIDFGMPLARVEDRTQRIRIHNMVNGGRVKLHFTNPAGEELVLEQVAIAALLPENQAGEPCLVTCQGDGRFRVPAKGEIVSDELEYQMEAGKDYLVSIYVREEFILAYGCMTSAEKSWQVLWEGEGNHVADCSLPASDVTDGGAAGTSASENDAPAFPPIWLAWGLSSLRVETGDEVKTIALFGDSITHMSFFSDPLQDLLEERVPGRFTVVNCGIAGNRLLHDASYVEEMPGHGVLFGEAGAARFERDVYGEDVPEYVLVLEGVNDCMHPYQFGHLDEIVNAEQLAEGTRALIRAAHAHGSQIWIGTIMPFGNDEMDPLPEAEATRLEWNDWIRSQKEADGVLDYDAALRDSARPGYMLPGFHQGDGLHPNFEGGKIMAEVVWKMLETL